MIIGNNEWASDDSIPKIIQNSTKTLFNAMRWGRTRWINKDKCVEGEHDELTNTKKTIW